MCSFSRSDIWKLNLAAIIFFPCIMDFRCLFCGEFIDKEYVVALKLAIFGIPQFIRRPVWLKDKLQNVRSKFGPLYVLSVMEYRCIVNEMLVAVALFLAILAGIFFRPDNATMLTLFGIGTTPYQRRQFHRWTMMLSFVLFGVSAACRVMRTVTVG